MEPKHQTEEEEYQEEEEGLFSILEIERQDWDEVENIRGQMEESKCGVMTSKIEKRQLGKLSGQDGAVRRKADEDEEVPQENRVLY